MVDGELSNFNPKKFNVLQIYHNTNYENKKCLINVH